VSTMVDLVLVMACVLWYIISSAHIHSSIRFCFPTLHCNKVCILCMLVVKVVHTLLILMTVLNFL
jgi:hypothetical protein